MPTFIGHAFSALAINNTAHLRRNSLKIMVLAVVVAVLPDFDVIAFKLGIPYSHTFGHRGFSHSITFALLMGFLVSRLFFRGTPVRSKQFLRLFVGFSLVGISHGVLDAMTNGGLGIAFFSPFSNARHFFPWRPIPVSYIGFSFFRHGGIGILKTELLYIILPSLAYLGLLSFLKRRDRASKD